MKTDINKCPDCGGRLWSQLGNPKEKSEGISYRVCTTHNCKFKMKVRWNAETQKINILP